MSAEVETMAWTNEVPWHGLGVEVQPGLSPAKMAKAAGVDWKVEKRPIFLENGKKIPDQFAIVRETDESTLTIVGKGYKPVQNLEALDFFKQFCDAGKMTLDTAGSLNKGRFIWGLADINRDFNVGKKDDKMLSKLLLMIPHVRAKSLVIKYTNVRVVCKNTMAVSLRDKGLSYRFSHNREFNDKAKDEARQVLQLAIDTSEEQQKAFTAFSKVKMTEKDADEFFAELLNVDLGDEDEVVKVKSRRFRQMKEALTYAPGQQLSSAEGTLWGTFNAVTYVADHVLGRTRDKALTNAWFGTTSSMKQKAFKLATQRIN